MCSIAVGTFGGLSSINNPPHMFIESRNDYETYLGGTMDCDLYYNLDLEEDMSDLEEDMSDEEEDMLDEEEDMSDEDILLKCSEIMNSHWSDEYMSDEDILLKCSGIMNSPWSDEVTDRASCLLQTMFRFLMLRHNPTTETVHNLLITLDRAKKSFQSQGIDVSKLIMAEELVMQNKFCNQNNCNHYFFGTHEENQADGYMTIPENSTTSDDGLVRTTLTSESLWVYNKDFDAFFDLKNSLIKGVSGRSIYDLVFAPSPTWVRVLRQRPSETELELANKRLAPDSFTIDKLGVFMPMKGVTHCCEAGTDVASLLNSFAREEAENSIYFRAILKATSISYKNLVKSN